MKKPLKNPNGYLAAFEAGILDVVIRAERRFAQRSLTQPLANYLGKKSEFIQLARDSDQEERLLLLLTQYLDPKLVAHITSHSLTRGVLTLATDSSAWATQLKYRAPDVLAKLRSEKGLHGLKSIKCRVKKSDEKTTPAATHTNTRRSLSGSRHVSATAETIEHPGLRAALTKLARDLKSK